jgi:hypothetical protein
VAGMYPAKLCAKWAGIVDHSHAQAHTARQVRLARTAPCSP